jgi:hypothetical protein
MARVANDGGNTAKHSPSEPDTGPGRPADALSSAVAELLKPPAVATPDANVARAVATGWHAREALTAAQEADEDEVVPRSLFGRWLAGLVSVLHRAPPVRRAPAFVEDVVAAEASFLKGVGAFRGRERVALVCAQLSTDVTLLGEVLRAAGQESGSLTAAIKALAAPADHQRSNRARALASLLVQQLTAADFRLGKAFALGWDLASLRRVGQDADNYRMTFAEAFLKHEPEITDRLTDLASALPAHAGHSVRASVGFWTSALAGKTAPKPGDVVARAPLRPRADLSKCKFEQEDVAVQLGRWRSLLTAEKAAKDELEAADYVRVAAGLARWLAETLTAGAKRAPLAWLLLPVAVIGLIAIGVVVIVVFDHTAAGVTALIGALGLTWKGVGSTIGRGLARVEQPAWDAQMDSVIARRITYENCRPCKVTPPPDEAAQSVTGCLSQKDAAVHHAEAGVHVRGTGRVIPE